LQWHNPDKEVYLRINFYTYKLVFNFTCENTTIKKNPTSSSPESKAVKVGLDSEIGIIFFSGFSIFSSPLIFIMNKTRTEK